MSIPVDFYAKVILRGLYAPVEYLSRLEMNSNLVIVESLYIALIT